MKGSLWLAWGLFGLYAVWLTALQGALASPRQLGEWAPDLGLVLLFAWAGRLRGGRGPFAVLGVALARASFAADPPLAIAAALLGAVGLFAALRTMLEVDRALPRALLCGLGAWGTATLLVTGRSLALAAESPAVRLEGVRLWPGALASALACFVLAPLLARLPGLASLGRARP